jgi:hypothetical protein
LLLGEPASLHPSVPLSGCGLYFYLEEFSGLRSYSGSPVVSAAEGGEIFIERSTRDVYGAFSSDFDSPEQVSSLSS